MNIYSWEPQYSANDKLAMGNLKPGKRDGNFDVMSDHIIACQF